MQLLPSGSLQPRAILTSAKPLGRRQKCGTKMHLGEEEELLHLAGMVRGKSLTLFRPAWVGFLEKGHRSNHWEEDSLQSPQVGIFLPGSHSHQHLGKTEQALEEVGLWANVESMGPSGPSKLHNRHSTRGSGPNLYCKSDATRVPGVPSTLGYSSFTKHSPHNSVFLKAQALEPE